VHEERQPITALTTRNQMDLAGGLNRRVQATLQVFSQCFIRQALAMIPLSHLFALLLKEDVIRCRQHAKKISKLKFFCVLEVVFNVFFNKGAFSQRAVRPLFSLTTRKQGKTTKEGVQR
jgi:hypothetical protein